MNRGLSFILSRNGGFAKEMVAPNKRIAPPVRARRAIYKYGFNTRATFKVKDGFVRHTIL